MAAWKACLDLRQAVLENVAEADQNRQLDPPGLELIDQLLQVDRSVADPCPDERRRFPPH